MLWKMVSESGMFLTRCGKISPEFSKLKSSTGKFGVGSACDAITLTWSKCSLVVGELALNSLPVCAGLVVLQLRVHMEAESLVYTGLTWPGTSDF